MESELIESIFRSSEFSFSGSKLLTLTGISDLFLHLDLPCETSYEKVIQGFFLMATFFILRVDRPVTREMSRDRDTLTREGLQHRYNLFWSSVNL